VALADAILVCLTERPMTGYELAKTFDSSIGFFWRASHQQIYRELQQLLGHGLVDGRDVIQADRPNKTIYTITKKGLAHVRAWSRDLTDRPPVRDNMLLKLYALDKIDLGALATEITNRLDKHRARLVIYSRIMAQRYSNRQLGLRETGRLLGLQVGLMTERGYVSWCEEALTALASMQKRHDGCASKVSRENHGRRRQTRDQR
jgi:DNA-binding PadR family transcriptional regulator